MKKKMLFLILFVSFLLGMAACTPEKKLNENQASLLFSGNENFYYGEADAPINMSIFMDFECESCKQFHEMVDKNFQEKYIDKGVIKISLYQLPSANEVSAIKTQLAMAINEANPELTKELIDNLYRLSSEESLKMTEPAFVKQKVEEWFPQTDLKMEINQAFENNEVIKNKIAHNFVLAEELGLEQTPSVYINDIRVKNPSSLPELNILIKKEIDLPNW